MEYASSRRPTAALQGDVLVLEGFCEHDLEVLAVAREAEDLERTVHSLLRVGARAYRSARVSVDTVFVQKEFESLRLQLEGAMGETVRQIGRTAEGLLGGDNGALPLLMARWQETAVKAQQEWSQNLARLLADSFDGTNTTSVLAKIQHAVGEICARQLEELRKVVSPDVQGGAFDRLRTEMERSLKDRTDSILQALAQLNERISVQAAQRQMTDKTAIKGFTYEEIVHAALVPIAALTGDLAQRVSRTPGVNGTNLGDEIVTLNEEDTLGKAAAYVAEVKDKPVNLRSVLDEVDKAMANREAHAGLVVCAKQGQTGLAVPFQTFGDKAIVVLDKDEQDDRALKLGALFARWVVRRQLLEGVETLNLDRVEALIATAGRALNRASTMRRYLTTAKKDIDLAGGELADLVAEVDAALTVLKREIGR